jgi:hypothetical protein
MLIDTNLTRILKFWLGGTNFLEMFMIGRTCQRSKRSGGYIGGDSLTHCVLCERTE